MIGCVRHIRSDLADVGVTGGLGPGLVDPALLTVVVRVVGVIVCIGSRSGHSPTGIPGEVGFNPIVGGVTYQFADYKRALTAADSRDPSALPAAIAVAAFIT